MRREAYRTGVRLNRSPCFSGIWKKTVALARSGRRQCAPGHGNRPLLRLRRRAESDQPLPSLGRSPVCAAERGGKHAGHGSRCARARRRHLALHQRLAQAPWNRPEAEDIIRRSSCFSQITNSTPRPSRLASPPHPAPRFRRRRSPNLSTLTATPLSWRGRGKACVRWSGKTAANGAEKNRVRLSCRGAPSAGSRPSKLPGWRCPRQSAS